ncbi:hypothetical protein ACKW6Q_11170 [Chryseobacterium kwangjuense]|uniref:Bacteriocin n=1 Tax=Chryseobacterium kwangjuense TaxID=267125 RepID=A0ABW9K2N6_9FLAO
MKTKLHTLKQLSRRELLAISGSGIAVAGGGNGGTNNGGTNGNIVGYCRIHPCTPEELGISPQP